MLAGIVLVALVMVGCGTDSGGGTTAADGQSGSETAMAEATAGSDAMPDTLPLRLGTQGDFPTHEPLTTARERGYFEEAGLDVEITNVGSESDCVLAMVADSLDVCVPTPEAVLRANAAGATDVRILAGLGQPAVHGVVALPEITSFEDLRGQALAVTGEREGSTLGLLAVLEANGVTVDDVDLITVGGTSARLAALETGEVAAAALSQPAEYQAVDDGYVLLGHTGEGTPQVTTVAGRVGVSEEKDEALTRFLTAMVNAAEWVTNPANEAEVVQHWMEVFEASEEHAQETYDLYQEIGSPRADMSVDTELMQNYIDLYGDEFAETNIEDYIDTSLLEEARSR